jgi:hypothetical protein
MPSKITINTDGISNAQKVTVKFQSAYRDMLAQLTAPGFAEILCAHEAAHIVYFTMVGMQSYEALPARLEYDPKRDDYDGHLAAVQLGEFPRWTQGHFADWFSMVARAHVAGGVVARKLMAGKPCRGYDVTGGDQDDKNRFVALCTLLNSDPNVSINAESVWKQAQESVLEQLETPEFMSAIEKEAAKLRAELGL